MTVTETLIRRVFDLYEEQEYKILVLIDKLEAQSPYHTEIIE